ncbi:MAG: mechanosensitive ion channel family protein [Pseudomonadales bacterium]|nr:mechanosensitive ion channel family protein [Pseudomonadales bacterium]
MGTLRFLAIPTILTTLLVAMANSAPALTTALPENVAYWILKGLQTAGWIAGAWLLNRLLDRFFWGGLIKNSLKREPPRLIVQLFGVAIYLTAFGVILAWVFDQPVTAFWATTGGLGVVVGFALQNLILDTFSGLAIHLERPFTVGDWINVRTRMGEFIGRVEETNWRTTRLWTTERNLIIIPNSYMTTTIVVNFSLPNKFARFELDFLIDFNVPTDRVVRVLEAALKSAIGDKGPLADPAPKVRIDKVDEEGVTYRARYYLDPGLVSPAKARHTILTKVMNHLHHSGIALTYPKQDVYIADMPWRQKDWEYQKDQIRQLQRLSLFRLLNEDDLDFLASEMKVVQHKQGHTIVTQHAEGSSMYILAEGILDVEITTEDNRQLKVATLEPGDFFGEKSLLTGELRSATVTCAMDAVVGEITKETISRLIERNPDVAQLLSVAVARRAAENTTALLSSGKSQEEFVENETARIFDGLKRFFKLTL